MAGSGNAGGMTAANKQQQMFNAMLAQYGQNDQGGYGNGSYQYSNPYASQSGQYSPYAQQASAYNNYMTQQNQATQNYNTGMNGLMGNYTNQYQAETARQQAIDNYWIQWNQGEVNKNLGLGRLSNDLTLGLGDINVRRDLGAMGLAGTRDTNATNKQIADWNSARGLQGSMYGDDARTLQARIANEPALRGMDLSMQKFSQVFPWIQGMFGGGGAMSGYGDVNAAGDYGMDFNTQVVPTPGTVQQAQFLSQNTGPNSGLPSAAQSAAAAPASYASPDQGTTDPYANYKPGGVGDPSSGHWVDQPGGAMQEWEWTDGKTHPAIANARLKPPGSPPSPPTQKSTNTTAQSPIANPFADKIAELKQKRDQLAANQSRLEAAAGAGGGRIKGDFGNAIKDIDKQIEMYNQQGKVTQATLYGGAAFSPDGGKTGSTAAGGGLVYDQGAGRWVSSGSPSAPTTPANAAMSASSAARAAAAMPQGMAPSQAVARNVNGMPMPQNFGGQQAGGQFNGGTAQGPVLFDDLASRANNAAPQYDQSPMYGASLQNRMGNIGMNAFDLEAYNAGKMMDKNRAPTGMSVAKTSPYNQGMKTMFNAGAGIGKYNAGANTAMGMAQGNAQHALAMGNARNQQYQNSLNYGMQRRNQNLQGQQVKLQSQQPMWNILGGMLS